MRRIKCRSCGDKKIKPWIREYNKKPYCHDCMNDLSDIAEIKRRLLRRKILIIERGG